MATKDKKPEDPFDPELPLLEGERVSLLGGLITVSLVRDGSDVQVVLVNQTDLQVDVEVGSKKSATKLKDNSKVKGESKQSKLPVGIRDTKEVDLNLTVNAYPKTGKAG